MAERKKLLHIRSNVVNDGKPKLPDPNNLDCGEIAVNYAEGYETLSIKNSGGKIATFTNEVMVGDSKAENDDGSTNPNYKAPVEGSGVEIFIDEGEEAPVIDLYTKSDIDAKVKALDGKDDELESEIKGLITLNETDTNVMLTVMEHEDNIEICTKSEFNTQVTALGDKDTDLQNQINALGNTDSNLQNQINLLGNNTNTLSQSIDDLETSVSGLQSSDTNLNTRINELITVTDSSGDSQSFIQISTDEDVNIEVYSKANVDALFAKLVNLNPSLNWE